MALGMTGTPDAMLVGQTVTYTMSVTNLGPVPASGVAVTNTLPANLSFVSASAPPGVSYSANQNVVTFNLGAMAIGQSVTVSLTATGLAAGPGRRFRRRGGLPGGHQPCQQHRHGDHDGQPPAAAHSPTSGRSRGHRRVYHLDDSLQCHRPGGLWIDRAHQRVVLESNPHQPPCGPGDGTAAGYQLCISSPFRYVRGAGHGQRRLFHDFFRDPGHHRRQLFGTGVADQRGGGRHLRR